MHGKERFLGIFTYLHAMLYAKMFYGYDILKHEFIVNLTDVIYLSEERRRKGEENA